MVVLSVLWQTFDGAIGSKSTVMVVLSVHR